MILIIIAEAITVAVLIWGWYEESTELKRKNKLGGELLKSYKIVLNQAERYSAELSSERSISDGLRIALLKSQEELANEKRNT